MDFDEVQKKDIHLILMYMREDNYCWVPGKDGNQTELILQILMIFYLKKIGLCKCARTEITNISHCKGTLFSLWV